MPRSFYLSECGDDDFGFSWEIHLREEDSNRTRCVATCHDEKIAEQILSALHWVESLSEGMMKLGMDGILIDPRTGMVKRAPKPRVKAPLQIIFTPAKSRKTK